MRETGKPPVTTTAKKNKRRAAKRRTRRQAKPEKIIHGFDGKRDLRTAIVPDPGNPKNVRLVTVNTRESGIAQMIARKQLNGAQGRAAEKFAVIYYGLNAGGAGAIDTSRPVVDTSGRSSAIPDSVIECGFAMSECARLLGMNEFAVVALVAGDGFALKDVAFTFTGRDDKATINAIGRVLRSGLDQLAALWGLAGGKQSQLRVRAFLSMVTVGGVTVSREKISATISRR